MINKWRLLYHQTIIIGGGPSGLMAAVAASEQSQNVLLLEKRVWVENLKFQVVVDAMLQIVYLTQKL